MKIGVHFTAEKKQGGVYQYSISFLEAISKIKGNDYIIITSSKDLPKKYYDLANFKVINILTGEKNKIYIDGERTYNNFQPFLLKMTGELHKLKLFKLISFINYLINRKAVDILRKQKLDLIFYLSASHLVTLVQVPFVTIIYDLQHRLNPRFKEVSAGGRFENREYDTSYVCRHAYKLFVDSEIGKEDLQKCYNVGSERVVVLPYLPPSYLSTKISSKKAGDEIRKLRLPKDYIFYPAKFWPHKNHINLIKALHILKKNGKNVNLVLTGSKDADFSSFEETVKLVKKYDLSDQVIYLGLVNNEELSVIYKYARAMVMPTYFGPTNIPVLEAWEMGVPVIYSDIRGCREQLGDAGLLINPDKPSDIAKKIKKIYFNPGTATGFVREGRRKVNSWTFSGFSKIIGGVLNDFAKVRNKYD